MRYFSILMSEARAKWIFFLYTFCLTASLFIELNPIARVLLRSSGQVLWDLNVAFSMVSRVVLGVVAVILGYYKLIELCHKIKRLQFCFKMISLFLSLICFPTFFYVAPQTLLIILEPNNRFCFFGVSSWISQWYVFIVMISVGFFLVLHFINFSSTDKKFYVKYSVVSLIGAIIFSALLSFLEK